MYDELQQFMESITEWSNKTFPDTAGDPIPPARHLVKEAKELLEALEDETKTREEKEKEIADNFILLLQIACKTKVSAQRLFYIAGDKFRENQARKWKHTGDGVYEHVKEFDEEDQKRRDLDSVGEVLRYLRIKAGYDVKQLADLMEIKPKELEDLENSRSMVSMSVLYKALQHLNISSTTFFKCTEKGEWPYGDEKFSVV